jgi:hypothetical protein
MVLTCAAFGSPRASCKLLQTYSRGAITAEVASSSLVVPAIFFEHIQLGCCSCRPNSTRLHPSCGCALD